MLPVKHHAAINKRSRAIFWSLLALGILVGGPLSYARIFSTARATYQVNGFRFIGPVGLTQEAVLWRSDEGAVGCDRPTFVVGSLIDLGVAWQPPSGYETSTVGDYTALIARSRVIAPGAGPTTRGVGMDTHISVYVPSLGEGLSIYYRTHNDDSRQPYDHIEARRCRLWADDVISSMEWNPQE